VVASAKVARQRILMIRSIDRAAMNEVFLSLGFAWKNFGIVCIFVLDRIRDS